MTNRHARSRSPPVPTERVPKEQLPPFRPVILMVDMMPLKSLHEINEDRFKPLLSVIASRIDDEEMKRAFSYSKFIPPDRLEVVTVRDVTKKVCKRFFAHFNVKLFQEEVELHIDDAFGRRELLPEWTILEVLRGKQPGWERIPDGVESAHTLRVTCHRGRFLNEQ